jgi:Circadian oscillating protein COP23
MDNGKAIASEEQVSIAYDPYREKELSLKEREIELKELEIKSQLEINRRNTWLGSPLLIAFITVLVGSIGTAFFQSYSNNQLERQKFEFSLILKALEGKDKNILIGSDGTDAAKRLRFLVELGVIKSLDSDVIDKLSRKPNDLPTFGSDSSVPNVNISCELSKVGVPTTVIQRSVNGSNEPVKIEIIKWMTVGNFDNLSPKERCDQASMRLQKALKKGTIILTTGNKNGENVICTTSKVGGPCENVLFTIRHDQDARLILEELLNTTSSRNRSSSPIIQ